MILSRFKPACSCLYNCLGEGTGLVHIKKLQSWCPSTSLVVVFSALEGHGASACLARLNLRLVCIVLCGGISLSRFITVFAISVEDHVNFSPKLQCRIIQLRARPNALGNHCSSKSLLLTWQVGYHLSSSAIDATHSLSPLRLVWQFFDVPDSVLSDSTRWSDSSFFRS